MSRTTDAEMANTYALAYVSWWIVVLRVLWFIPKYRTQLIVLRHHKAKLEARESGLGEGSRPRRKSEPVPKLLEDAS